MTEMQRSASRTPLAPGATDADAITLVGLVNGLLRQRRSIVLSAVLVAGIAVTWSVVRSPYVATATFAPAAQASAVQGVTSVAQAFGINLSEGGGGPSLDFYSALLGSRELLTATVQTRYRFARGPEPSDSVSKTLLEIYGFDAGDTSATTLLKVMTALKKDLTVSEDAGANTITLEVRAPWPGLAEAVASRMLALVNEFDVEQLQSQASAERRFLEQRVDSTRVRLRAAEDSMRSFLERNRSVENSPRLVFEGQRLQRAVDLQQQVYAALNQSYEQARLAEVRNTPVITVVDAPAGSALRQRHALRNGVVGVFVGLAIGVLIGMAREHLRRERETYPGEFAELEQLRRGLFHVRQRDGTPGA